MVVGLELRASASVALPLEPFCKPFFVLSISEIESCKLFAQAGLEPQTS
jgi:hypothetical protein